MAMGFGMAQEMMNRCSSPRRLPASRPWGHRGARCLLARRGPGRPSCPGHAGRRRPGVAGLHAEQAAQLLGVDVADVLAELEAGHLKGRKIGANWRIAQAALDQFLQGSSPPCTALPLRGVPYREPLRGQALARCP